MAFNPLIDGFSYRSGILSVENVELAMIADQVGSPCYVYSTARLQQNYRNFTTGFAGMNVTLFYANKANPNLAVTQVLIDCGAGVDITSVGEMERAMKAGAPPSKIMYSGVGKRRDEIEAALINDIYQINVESIPELRQINDVAKAMNRKAVVTLRVNPDVDPKTHKKISTGELGTKFGIDLAQLDEVMEIIRGLPHIDLKGFQVHIGSHVSDYEPFRTAYAKVAELTQHWRGRGFKIDRLDLGGGVAIAYDGQTEAPFSDYVAIVRATVGHTGCELAFEPGRRLVGDAGLMLSRVVYDKQGLNKRFLILDSGMNDLLRPAMYDARHSIVPVKESLAKSPLADVVGPVCETSDLFGEAYDLPGVGQGDLVAILQAGAYGCSMSSNYNGRPLIAEVLVSGDQFAVVRRRIAVAEQLEWEQLPTWAKAKTGESVPGGYRTATG